ncbi:MAG: EFR1 family ferrodoxin [Methanomassiliicoccaceae archaeon]|nr:EFR1 family ferrodoxin [Methanomassiliicoccaceae archaeon]
MLGIYFSGNGNTKYCVERFMERYDGSPAVSIEDPAIIDLLQGNDDIVLGYPVHFGNVPKMVQDFLIRNREYFVGKNIFVICTMRIFSGDGAGCGAKILREHGAVVTGGLHLTMPDCVSDLKAVKTPAENRQRIGKAESRIVESVEALKQGRPTQDGMSSVHYAAGMLLQRMWVGGKTKNYSDKLRIDDERCVGCGKCIGLCPMRNLSSSDGRIIPEGRCTMCYRCINNCPNKAITLLGREVYEQYRLEDQLSEADDSDEM